MNTTSFLLHCLFQLLIESTQHHRKYININKYSFHRILGNSKKFDGTNFHTWKVQMKMVLNKDVWNVVDGSELKPSTLGTR